MYDQDEFESRLSITIKTSNVKIEINESSGTVINFDKNTNNIKNNIRFHKISDLTGSNVDQILENSHPPLTTFDECMTYHIPMIDAFNNQITKITGVKTTTCPIT